MRNGMLDGRPDDMGALSNAIGQSVEDQQQHLAKFMANTDGLRAGFGGPAADFNDEGALNCHSHSTTTVVHRGEGQQSGVLQMRNMYDADISYTSGLMSGILNPGTV
ncbi:hypothetical protein ACWCOV_10465 [Kribbella sp. NPDC002412]